jgi:hypothetical protein
MEYDSKKKEEKKTIGDGVVVAASIPALSY